MAFIPSIPPNDTPETRWVLSELRRLSQELEAPREIITYKQLNAAPERYENGTTAYADGTNWNPGAGEGVYIYNGTKWIKLSNTIKYLTPSSVSVVTGGTATGTVAGVQALNDGSEYGVMEVSGTPGFDIQFSITGVLDFSYIATNIHYDGSTTHFVTLEIYNVSSTTWEAVTIVPPSSTYNLRFVAWPHSSADYIDSGTVKIRAYHATSGVPSHDIYFDYIAVGA